MTDFRHDIHALIDGEQTELLPHGSHVLVSVIMSDHPPVDGHSPPWLEPAAVMLRPQQARELAFELLELAEHADQSGVRR